MTKNMFQLNFSWQHVHFVGVGGVGMAGLAHIMLDCGVTVTGTDARDSSMLRSLAARGASVRGGDSALDLESIDIVVYSSAIPEDHRELLSARELGVPTRLRGKFLADVAEYFGRVISVAGSHGKTTTTAMIVHLLAEAGMNPGFLVGGEVNGWERSGAAGNGEILVTEVDESDGSQGYMRSACAVVLNVEDDHCWNLGGVEQLERSFVELAESSDHLLVWKTPETERLFGNHPKLRFLGNSELPNASDLPVPGEHNRVNASLALAVSRELGVASPQAKSALQSFPGVSRRLTQRWRSPGNNAVVVEDYAHHPTEVNASLIALREKYPESRMTVVFQPHRFERVRRYAAEFGKSLSRADRVVVIPPFAAWRDNAEIADPREIVSGITSHRGEFSDASFDELAQRLVTEEFSRDDSVLFVIMGAGTISVLVDPLVSALVAECHDHISRNAEELFQPGLLTRKFPWKELTTLGIGAATPLLAQPNDISQLRKILDFARERDIPAMAVGAGSNILGTDRPRVLLAVRLRQGEFAEIDICEGVARVGAGVALHVLIRELATRGRLPGGFDALAGIPGTVGGAVIGNAGAGGYCVGEFIHRIRGFLPSGDPWEKSGTAVRWEYRESDIPDRLVITEVDFLTEARDSDEALRKIGRCEKERWKRQPKGRSAGCVFRNPESDSAGRLLDVSGCGGMKVGQCRVSSKHANFFIAEPGAAEADYIQLIRQARERVRQAFDIDLVPEIGFGAGLWGKLS